MSLILATTSSRERKLRPKNARMSAPDRVEPATAAAMLSIGNPSLMAKDLSLDRLKNCMHGLVSRGS